MSERNLLIKLLGDASNLNKAFKEAGGGADGMGGVFDKMKGKLAAALSVTAVAAFAGDTVKAFEKVAGATAKLQRLTGGTAEDMSRLGFEAKESGVSQELLEKSLTKMSKAMMSNVPAFAKLGVATKDAQGNMRPMGDVMLDLSEKFKAMPAGAEKNALAMQLFGKSGTDMLPMLNRGKDALAEFGKESDQFGLTIGQKSVDAYKKHVAESRKMHAAMEGLKVQIGEKLAPIFYKFAAFMAVNLPKAIDFVKGVLESLRPTFQAIGEWIASLVVWWKAHWDQISTTVQNVFGYIQGFIETTVAVIEVIWRNFGENIIGYLTGAWEIIKAIFTGAFEIIHGIFDLFRDIFTGKWGKLWGDIQLVIQGVWDAIRGIVQGAVDGLTAILGIAWTVITTAAGVAWDLIKAAITIPIDAVAAVLQGIWDTITGAASTAWDWISTLAGLAWDGIKSAITVPIDAITAVLQGIWDGITTAASTAWNAVKDVIEPIINEIKSIIQGAIDIANDVIGVFKSIGNFFGGSSSTQPVGTVSISGTPVKVGGPKTYVPGNAKGTNFWEGGWTLLGEDGPELANVPRGTAIHDTNTSRRMLNGGMGGHTFITQFHGVTDIPALATANAREIGWRLRAS